jgi:flagellar biosynthesis/type III secretory pathway chaperone
MNARCRPWRIAAMGLMMLGQSLVWAKGPVSNIIYDPTNHAKNLLSAEQSGQQVLEMIKAAMTLANTVDELGRSRAQEVTSVLFGSGPVTAAEVARRMSELQRFHSDLERLNGGLKDMKSRFDVRFNSAQRLNLSMKDYYEGVVRNADQGVRAAQLLVDADRKTMQRVSATYGQIQQWQRGLPNVESQVAGLQRLNGQMNLLVAQNGEVLAMMARESSAEAEKSMMEAADAEARAQESRDVMSKGTRDFQASRDAALTRRPTR